MIVILYLIHSMARIKKNLIPIQEKLKKHLNFEVGIIGCLLLYV